MKRILALCMAAALLAPFALMPAAETLQGDADGDGAVTSTDARMALQYSVGKIGEGDLDLAAADVDGDGDITSTDARMILQYSVGKIRFARYAWAEDLPRMDGSTSTIPLEAGIRAALLGITQEEAEKQVTHSTTYGSFYNLLDDKCDLIFSVPLSEEQIAEAAEKGKTLEMVKIAAEGFVFVVNAKNPVDTLSQQQLKDIYSGKITNWSQVGGNDAPIVAYQRNETSGSQNFMHTFMGDTPLMEPVTEFIPYSMGSLMDAVAVYDNAENAIGYSVYAYAADMYGNGNEIKFIQVDGVAPTKATMAAGEYPLLGYNYAVFDAAAPADSSPRRLAAWLVTEEGQQAIRAAGYIPVLPLGDIAEAVFEPYTGVGTGPEKPADFQPSPVRYRVRIPYQASHGKAMTLDIFEDNEMAKQVNGFITSHLKGDNKGTSTSMICECINGYLSVEMTNEYPDGNSEVNTAIYDLVEGREIAYSDLCFKGEEYIPAVNAALEDWFNRQDAADPDNGMVPVYELKRPFAGLEAGHKAFSLTTVLYGKNNLYTAEGHRVTVTGVYGKSVLSAPRDLTGVFKEGVEILPELATEDMYGYYLPLLPGKRSAQLLSETAYPASVWEPVNRWAREICETELSVQAISDLYGHPFEEAVGMQTRLQLWADRWIILDGGCSDAYFKDVPGDSDQGHDAGLAGRIFHVYDLSAGKEIPYTDLLKEGWQEAADWRDDRQQPVTREEIGDLSGWHHYQLTVGITGQLVLYFNRGIPAFRNIYAYLPLEYLKG